MQRSRFSEEQVAYGLRQAEGGAAVADVCRQLGVSEATFYLWKKQYTRRGVNELHRLRQVEDENRRWKQLVADLALDKHMWTEALRKNLRPTRRRALAEWFQAVFQASVVRACALADFSRAGWYKPSTAWDQAPLRTRRPWKPLHKIWPLPVSTAGLAKKTARRLICPSRAPLDQARGTLGGSPG